MRVAKWGNSLAIRLPRAVVDRLEIKEGDEVEIRPLGHHEIEIEKKPSAHEMLVGLRKYRGRVPASYKFKRKDAYEDD
jgi:antitoxin MazE